MPPTTTHANTLNKLSLMKFKKVALQAKCRELGHRVTGNKSELVDRILSGKAKTIRRPTLLSLKKRSEKLESIMSSFEGATREIKNYTWANRERSVSNARRLDELENIVRRNTGQIESIMTRRTTKASIEVKNVMASLSPHQQHQLLNSFLRSNQKNDRLRRLQK